MKFAKELERDLVPGEPLHAIQLPLIRPALTSSRMESQISELQSGEEIRQGGRPRRQSRKWDARLGQTWL